MTDRLATALHDAMAQLNQCWPHWREMASADIRLGDRLIAGPVPDPWQRSAEQVAALLKDQPSLAALNPQPLPPLPVDVAVGLEIADRLIGMATIASQIGPWLAPEAGRQDLVAARLAAEVESLCPLRPKPKIKLPHDPHPAPDPEPHEVELSPLAQLAIGARFEAAARGASTEDLRHGFAHAAERLSRAGLANLTA